MPASLAGREPLKLTRFNDLNPTLYLKDSLLGAANCTRETLINDRLTFYHFHNIQPNLSVSLERALFLSAIIFAWQRTSAPLNSIFLSRLPRIARLPGRVTAKADLYVRYRRHSRKFERIRNITLGPDG